MKNLFFSILLIIPLFLFAQNSKSLSDSELIKITVDKLYKSISFEKGEKAQFQKLETVFIEDAKLINNNYEKPYIQSVDGFIKVFEKQIAKGELLKFQEMELFHKTEIFGKIAQRFSTYKTEYQTDKIKNSSKGINSIQLIKVGEEWLITSIVWNDENEELKIPEEYKK